MSSDRGTGRTTKQMREAPQGAVFVWCNENLFYPKRLAEELGRTDLEIRSANYLLGDSWRGRRTPVVIDHYFKEVHSIPEDCWVYLSGHGLLA